MRIISKKKLTDFLSSHPDDQDAKGPMTAWYDAVSEATWEKFSDVRATYATASQVDQFTVFNVGGNKFRLYCRYWTHSCGAGFPACRQAGKPAPQRKNLSSGSIITVIQYETGIVYLRAALTHPEYDREHWKSDDFGKNFGRLWAKKSS